MPETILVADNEPDILRFVEANLRMEGFEVVLAADGAEALCKAVDDRPSLVVLDVMMPGLDGFEVCRRLRADPRTSQIPIIILTAKSLTVDKVVGLTAGADDYVLKPFDPIELVARVRTTLRRASDLRSTSPLTGLPGNHRIDAELRRRLADREPLAVLYADLNDFKSYNDRYGFLRGDDVIILTGELLVEALRERASSPWFVGHVGGDDFMVVCRPEELDGVCGYAIDRFDERVSHLYDPADLERGYVEVPDRQGQLRPFPPVTLSLGVASTEKRAFADHREIVQVATEMKAFVKHHQRGKSAYAVDGRAAEAE
jgi:diguanylate cyclase (GGDEF)-like protein